MGLVCRICGGHDKEYHVGVRTMCKDCKNAKARELHRSAILRRNIVNNRYSNDKPPADLSCECCGRSKTTISSGYGYFKPRFPGSKIPITLSRYGEYPGIYLSGKVLATKFRCLQAHGTVYTNWECKNCWHKNDAEWAAMVIKRKVYSTPEPIDDVPVEVPPDWYPGAGARLAGAITQKWDWLEWYYHEKSKFTRKLTKACVTRAAAEHLTT